MPRRVVDLLASCRGCFGWHCNREIWKAIPYCLMWCIWRERNAKNLDRCERSTLDWKTHFLRTLFQWLSALGKFSFSNLMEFNDYCSYKSYLYNLYLHLVFTCVLEQILGRAFGVLRCLNRCAFYGQ